MSDKVKFYYAKRRHGLALHLYVAYVLFCFVFFSFFRCVFCRCLRTELNSDTEGKKNNTRTFPFNSL